MNVKKLSSWLPATFAAAALMGSTFANAQEPIKISYVLAVTTLEWTSEIKAGAEAAVADLDFPVDVKFAGPSNFDPGKQASIFMNETQTSPDAMIITNVAAPLFIEPVREAQERGIAVTWTNASPAPDFYEGFFVSADPTQMGLEAADVLAKALEEKTGKPAADIEGTMVLGVCVPGLSVLENRVNGLRSGLEKLMPKVEVLPTIPTKPDREGSFAIWNQAMRKNAGALAYVDACEAGNLNIIRIVADDKLDALSLAFDVPGEVREAVADGTFLAASSSNFFMQGYMAVYATATALHADKPLPSGWLKIPATMVVQSNAGDYNEAWKDMQPGLRAYYDSDIEKAKAAFEDGDLSPVAEYDNPPN
ncbi:sugar ABC transporter substrate-binding protein [Hoeflea sp. WL0058]|uniref:Sugar ABC transporter substrate-binding protein n=1 Tax=Flavimaribacter sediminis TaxID=2865987 RepID=A0AAE3D204_9HYPH|nr:sugar ABC transporter substrate-binding protein [Flavimaribacter sediminis]MBW8638436.1 sugar ABC transporter substrate-binding protein [Flavimaribacter sediminis]